MTPHQLKLFVWLFVVGITLKTHPFTVGQNVSEFSGKVQTGCRVANQLIGKGQFVRKANTRVIPLK